MFCGVHTADFRAVCFAAARGVTAADTLNEHDRVRMFAVRRAEQCTGSRACCVGQTLEFERGDDVLALRVSELIKIVQFNRVKSGCNNDCTVFFLDDGILLFVINCADGAEFRADTAFAVFEHVAVVASIVATFGTACAKRDVDGTAIVHAHVEFVRHVFDRTFLGADAASGTFVLIDIACLFLDFYGEVADKAFDVCDFTVRIDLDFLVLCTINHFRGQDTCCTVECRERFVDLGHFAADGRLFLDDVDLKAGLCDVECGLDAGDTAADDERTFDNRAFACGQRCIQLYFCNSSLPKMIAFSVALRYLCESTSTAHGCLRSPPCRG